MPSPIGAASAISREGRSTWPRKEGRNGGAATMGPARARAGRAEARAPSTAPSRVSSTRAARDHLLTRIGVAQAAESPAQAGTGGKSRSGSFGQAVSVAHRPERMLAATRPVVGRPRSEPAAGRVRPLLVLEHLVDTTAQGSAADRGLHARLGGRGQLRTSTTSRLQGEPDSVSTSRSSAMVPRQTA